MRFNVVTSLITVFLTVPSANAVRALTPGDLDPGFGTAGVALADFENESNSAMAVQADGKIVCVGSASTGGLDDNVAVTRFNADGTLDTGFGAAGLVETDLGSAWDHGRAVAIQSDGKIVVAAMTLTTSSDIAVVRYLTNGDLDPSFGTGGMVITDISGATSEEPSSIAIQSDGKIVVGGWITPTTYWDFGVLRYTTSGELDVSFGADGVVTTDMNGGHERITSLAIQSDGKIVAVGYAAQDTSGANTDFAVARYTVDGDLDTSFGGVGFVTTAILSWNESAWAMSLQSDGKILAAGRVCFDSLCHTKNVAIVRFLSTGGIDTTFGTSGIEITDIPGTGDQAYGVAASPSGVIVAAGTVVASGKKDFFVACYDEHGSLDTGFGGSGIVTTDVNSDNDSATSVVLTNGGVLVGGTAYNLVEYNNDFAVVRYHGIDVFYDGFESGGCAEWSSAQTACQ